MTSGGSAVVSGGGNAKISLRLQYYVVLAGVAAIVVVACLKYMPAAAVAAVGYGFWGGEGQQQGTAGGGVAVAGRGGAPAAAASTASSATASGRPRVVIFNFGDSNSDTGGWAAAFGMSIALPEGRTYFRRPTGRLSDGRLVIDFFCESLNTPHLSPYLKALGADFSNGVNFAVGGSTATPGGSPFSLDVQLRQFLFFRTRSLELINQEVGVNGLVNLPRIIDLEYNDNGELVFKNFSLIVICIKCLRIFMTACHAAHIMGFVEALGLFLASLIGFCFHSVAIAIHMSSIRKSCAQTWMIGIAIYMGVGIGWLQYGMLIPVNQAWHASVVPTIIILTVLVEAILGVCSQINEDDNNEHLHLDLIMKLVETSIAIYRTVDCTRRDYRFQTEKLLVLLWNSLIMLIGTCRISWIVYKTGIICKVVDWLGRRGSDAEEGIPEPVIERDGDGNAAERVVEVVVLPV